MTQEGAICTCSRKGHASSTNVFVQPDREVIVGFGKGCLFNLSEAHT